LSDVLIEAPVATCT